MTDGPAVGIDLVDLRDPRCEGKAGDRRFVGRVLAQAEAEALGREAERSGPRAADALLWTQWAAKEAAFKAVTLGLGHVPPFEHARFVCDLVEAPGDDARLHGTVRYDERELPVLALAEGPRIVVLAWGPPPSDRPPRGLAWEAVPVDRAAERLGVAERGAFDDPTLGGRLSSAEARPVHSLPSALARLGARGAAARALGLDEARVEVVCPPGPSGRMPPRVHVDGRASDGVAVSLTHHHGWVAWAVLTG